MWPGVDDTVVRVAPALERVGDFAAFLAEDIDEDAAYLAALGGAALSHDANGNIVSVRVPLDEPSSQHLSLSSQRSPERGFSADFPPFCPRANTIWPHAWPTWRHDMGARCHIGRAARGPRKPRSFA